MSTAGPNSPGTAADDSAIGTLTWSNPSNIASSNDSKATVTGNGGAVSHYLKATNFGFSVPDATIDGVQFDIEMMKAGAGNCNDSVVKLVKADATLGSTDKGTDTNLATSDTVRTYGGAADTWGETLTETDVNDADFGVVISITFPGASCQAEVDHVTCTVTYTAAAGGTSTAKSLLLMGVG